MPTEFYQYFGVLCLIAVALLLYRQLRRSPRSREHEFHQTLEFPVVIGKADWDKLTPRQKDVARLAARGMSDSEIAQQLGITKYTVNTHLKSIYKKLNVNSRTELANRILDYINRDPFSSL